MKAFIIFMFLLFPLHSFAFNPNFPISSATPNPTSTGSAGECDPSQYSCRPGTINPRDGSINGYCDPSQQSCNPGTVGPNGVINTAPDGQSGGTSVTLDNPIGIDDLEVLVNRIGKVIVDLAIPIAVIVIIWSGVQFLLASGTPEKINKAKKTLWWAIIGLAVIFIGKGFISLIKDILSLQDK